MEGEETQHRISDVKWPIVRTWESPCCPLVWGNGKFEVVALKFPCSWHHCVTSKVKPCCFYFLPPSDDFSKVRVQKLKKRKNPQKLGVVLERVRIRKCPYLLLFQKAWVSFPASTLHGSAPGDLTTWHMWRVHIWTQTHIYMQRKGNLFLGKQIFFYFVFVCGVCRFTYLCMCTCRYTYLCVCTRVFTGTDGRWRSMPMSSLDWSIGPRNPLLWFSSINVTGTHCHTWLFTYLFSVAAGDWTQGLHSKHIIAESPPQP